MSGWNMCESANQGQVREAQRLSHSDTYQESVGVYKTGIKWKDDNQATREFKASVKQNE